MSDHDKGRLDRAVAVVERACVATLVGHRSRFLPGVVHLDRGHRWPGPVTLTLRVMFAASDTLFVWSWIIFRWLIISLGVLAAIFLVAVLLHLAAAWLMHRRGRAFISDHTRYGLRSHASAMLAHGAVTDYALP